MRRVTNKKLLALGIVISAVLAALVLRKADLRQSWAALLLVDPKLLVLPLLVAVVNYPLRAWRWQAIFPRESAPAFWRCFHVLSIGIAANNFLPGRAGDLARCTLLRRDFSLSATSLTFATLGIEKLADSLMLVVVVLFSLRFVLAPSWLSHALFIAASLCAVVLALFLLVHHKPQRVAGLVSAGLRAVRWKSLSEKVEHLFFAFAQGLGIVRSPGQIALVSALTLFIWVSEGALIWTLAFALHINLSFPGAFLVSAVLGLGLMIPAAPGAVGSYEFFSVAGLQLFGVDSSRALTLSVLLHAWVFIVNSVLGMICLWMAGMSLSQLRLQVSADSSTSSTRSENALS